MEFNNFHKLFFNAEEGAFSRVTGREFFDSQITLTDNEADILIRYLGQENINFGAVSENPEKSNKSFLLFPDMTPITLNVVFPKAAKKELRLYLSIKKGFKPTANEIWFIYSDEHRNLVIGSLEESIWNNLGQQDYIDEKYQVQIEETIATSIDEVDPAGRIKEIEVGGHKIFYRDPRIAILRFKESDYSCEIDPLHSTFIAERTKLKYVEAHHFIPIKFQPFFDFPLDSLNNIVSLCPNCHRGIHHGIIEHKYHLLNNIYHQRIEMQIHSIETVAQFYNCIRVPDE